MKKYIVNVVIFIVFGMTFSFVSSIPKKYISYSMDKLMDMHPELHKEFLEANQDLVLGRDSEKLSRISKDHRFVKIQGVADSLGWLAIIANYFILPIAFGFITTRMHSINRSKAVA